MSVNGNFSELYRLRFAPAAPADHDPHILWADTTASPAVLKTYQGGVWVPVAGGDAGQGGGVGSVAVAPPATNTGTPTAPVIGVAPATAQAAGSLAAADYGKLAGVQSGAQANVLEGVTGTAPITAGAVAGKQQAIGIVPATASVAGSMAPADKAKLDALPAGAQTNVLEDVTLASTTTALAVTNGAAGGIVAKVKALTLAIANAVGGGAAGLMTGADKAKLDGIATGAGIATTVAVTAPATNSGTATAPNIGVQAATAGQNGYLAAADFGKLGHLRASGTDDITVESTVRQVTASGKTNAAIGANAAFDGTNWDRYDTAQPAVALSLANDGSVRVYDTPAGANPISFTERVRVARLGAVAQLLFAADLGALSAKGTMHLCCNLSFDGTNWQRLVTSAPALFLRLGADNGLLEVYYAAPGANPVASFAVTTLYNPATYPATAWLDLGTVATYGTGWAAYTGGNQFRPMVRRLLDGTVTFRGLVAKLSAATVGETMFTMPAAWRPADAGYASAGSDVFYAAVSNGAACVIEFQSAGACLTGAGCNAVWVSLANVRYQNTA